MLKVEKGERGLGVAAVVISQEEGKIIGGGRFGKGYGRKN